MYKRLFMFLLGIALILLIILGVGVEETLQAIGSIPLRYLGLLLMIQLLTMLFSALKWRIVLRRMKVSFKNVAASTFVGYLVNNLTPVGMAGGEPVRAYLLAKREDKEMETVFSSVVVDLFLEMIPIFLLSALAIFLIVSGGVSLEIAAGLAISSLVLLLLFIFTIALASHKSFSAKVIEIVLNFVSKVPFFKKRTSRLRSEAYVMHEKFNDAIRRQMLDSRIVVSGTMVSFAIWSLRLLRVYVLFYSLGILIPLSVLIIVEAVVIIATCIPLSPGSLGIREGTTIALFVLLGGSGVTPVIATTVAMVDRIIFYVFPSLLGAGSAMYLGVNVPRLFSKEIKEDVEVDMESVSRIVGP